MCGGDLCWLMTVKQRQLFTYFITTLSCIFYLIFMWTTSPWTSPCTAAAPLHRHNVCDTSKSMCICCCSFHLESITSLQPGSPLHRGVCSIKSATHLNALDGISVEISPVCPGQSIKGPLKKKRKKKTEENWSAPDALASISPRLNHTKKQSGKQLVSRLMWVKNTDWVAARHINRFNYRLMGNKTGVRYNNCRHWRFHTGWVYHPHS